MAEIVKYNNRMNEINFAGFTGTDLNMFMALCARLRDKDTARIKFDLRQLKEITGYDAKDQKRFIRDLKQMNAKLQKISGEIETENAIITFVLFTTFTIDKKELSLEVAVNEDFKFLLNEITSNFTQFELSEFVRLKSKYAKNLYRLLKQFRTTGLFRCSLKDFRTKMDCPVDQATKFIKRDVINPAIKELLPYFPGLDCKSICARKRGAPVTGYEFTFEHEEAGDHANRQSKKKPGFNDFDQREYKDVETALLQASQKKAGYLIK